MKTALYKNILWIQLYEVLEQAKLISGEKIRIVMRWWALPGLEEVFGVEGNVLYL